MLKFWMKLSVASVLFLTACGDGEKEESAENKKDKKSDEKKTEEVCKYSFDENATTVQWTAFKFTNKTGVGGEFKIISVADLTEEGKSPYEVLKNASFSIPVSGLDTKNPDRDKKIKEHFFGTMENADQLKGQITSWEEGSESATLTLKMNGKEKDVDVNISIEGEKVTLTSTIDVVNFNAEASIDKLNEVCKDLHKGPDGESKLWSEVEIVVETTLNKVCE